VARKTSPYVHVIQVLLMTVSCGISRDRGKRLYIVETSFAATGLPEFSTSTQKEEKGGEDRNDSLLTVPKLLPSILSSRVSHTDQSDLCIGRSAEVFGIEHDSNKHDDAEAPIHLWNDRLTRPWRSLAGSDDIIDEGTLLAMNRLDSLFTYLFAGMNLGVCDIPQQWWSWKAPCVVCHVMISNRKGIFCAIFGANAKIGCHARKRGAQVFTRSRKGAGSL
jgi:hypothetical protein